MQFYKYRQTSDDVTGDRCVTADKYKTLRRCDKTMTRDGGKTGLEHHKMHETFTEVIRGD